MPWVDKNKCLGCRACINICPVGAISIKDGKAVIDQNKCIHCGKCYDVCPHGAIRPNFENPELRDHHDHQGRSEEGKHRRGFGRGRGAGKRGFGPEGNCVCPKCGYKKSHQRGVPCSSEICPKCGNQLIRE